MVASLRSQGLAQAAQLRRRDFDTSAIDPQHDSQNLAAFREGTRRKRVGPDLVIEVRSTQGDIASWQRQRGHRIMVPIAAVRESLYGPSQDPHSRAVAAAFWCCGRRRRLARAKVA